MKYKVSERDAGIRLDKFLAARLKNTTRSQIKKMISAGDVTIDGATPKVHQFLKVGQVVLVASKTKIGAMMSSISNRSTKKVLLIPDVVYEDNDVVVVNKPTGLLVHPTQRHEKDTLVSWVVSRYPAIRTVGENEMRPGIVHRLDRDVSGLLIVAKTQDAYTHLKTQFQQHAVEKEYRALVYGHASRPEGVIELPIGRNPAGQFVAHPRRGLNTFHHTDKVAKTRYRVLEYVKDYTLMAVTIETGRTHQIRVHLSAIGHPILGDQIYKPKKPFLKLLRQKIKVISLPRIFLHATRLALTLPNGQRQEFTSPLPDQLQQFLDAQKTT